MDSCRRQQTKLINSTVAPRHAHCVCVVFLSSCVVSFLRPAASSVLAEIPRATHLPPARYQGCTPNEQSGHTNKRHHRPATVRAWVACHPKSPFHQGREGRDGVGCKSANARGGYVEVEGLPNIRDGGPASAPPPHTCFPLSVLSCVLRGSAQGERRPDSTSATKESPTWTHGARRRRATHEGRGRQRGSSARARGKRAAVRVCEGRGRPHTTAPQRQSQWPSGSLARHSNTDS
jgi:hypothetical protein